MCRRGVFQLALLHQNLLWTARTYLPYPHIIHPSIGTALWNKQMRYTQQAWVANPNLLCKFCVVMNVSSEPTYAIVYAHTTKQGAQIFCTVHPGDDANICNLPQWCSTQLRDRWITEMNDEKWKESIFVLHLQVFFLGTYDVKLWITFVP